MATKTWAVSKDQLATDTGHGAGKDDHLFVGYASWLPGSVRSFLQFTLDWSGVVQITKAELHIKTSTGYHGSIGGSNQTHVDLVTASWSEGTHGADEVWWSGEGSFSRSVSTSYRASFNATADSTWEVVDITAIVNRWAPASVKQSNGSPGAAASNYGIRLMANSEGTAAGRTEFWAREKGTSYDAYITLTYSTNQAPVLQSYDSPANGALITDDTPSLVFTLDDPDAADTCTAYDIQVDDDPAFGSPAISLADQAIGSPANTVQVTHVCSALTRNATYYWRVKGTDNQGLKAASWSANQSFLLAALPTTGTYTPTGNAFATIWNLGELALWTDGSFAKPRLTFVYSNASSVAMASYRVRVYDAASAGNLVADTNVVNAVVASGAIVIVDLATAMPRNTSRWWTVEVVDAAGGNSGESARQQFRVQWGQAQYEANPGTSSTWSFQAPISGESQTGGQVVFGFRTATASDAGGGGTRSAWAANIGNLTPATWLNVFVRLTPTTAGTNVVLPSMKFTYQSSGSGTAPDNWTRSPSSEWLLSTAQRRFGAKSLKCTVVSGVTGDRYAYPFRSVDGDDIPVVPGVPYTFSAYVNTPAALTGGSLKVHIYQGGSLTEEVAAQYVTKASEQVTSTIAEKDGWKRITMTYTAPPGWTTVRPMIRYTRTSGVDESFYVDGAKHEEGPVATPWQAGAIGSVLLDSGGVFVDRQAGGTLRLRGQTGGSRDIVELGTSGLVFGGDTPVFSPTTRILYVGDDALAGPTQLRIVGGSSGSYGGALYLEGSASNGSWVIDTLAGDLEMYRSGLTSLTLPYNGGMVFGFNSMPASPVTNQMQFRTDLGMWFYYNGTRWLSAQLFTLVIGLHNVAVEPQAITATTAALHRDVVYTKGGSDLWLEDWAVSFYVSSGTLNGTNKWTGTLTGYASGSGTDGSSFATNDINSGATAVARQQVVSIDALMGNRVWLQSNWTEGGTIGSLQTYEEVTYRIVAT